MDNKHDLTLIRPAGLMEWLRIYRLYREAFPRYERKPFSIIFQMARSGKTDVWCCLKDNTFVGFASTINGEDLILLDYFAVVRDRRKAGLGSGILAKLQMIYAGKGLFVEIESVYDDAENREERIRRKQFYLANGMQQQTVMANVFGTNMELLGIGCKLDFAQYHAFYRDHYSAWAAQNIIEAHHPDASV